MRPTPVVAPKKRATAGEGLRLADGLFFEQNHRLTFEHHLAYHPFSLPDDLPLLAEHAHALAPEGLVQNQRKIFGGKITGVA